MNAALTLRRWPAATVWASVGGGVVAAAVGMVTVRPLWYLAVYLTIVAVGVPITVADLTERRIPRRLVQVGLLGVGTVLALQALASGDASLLAQAVGSAVVLSAVYGGVHLLVPAAVGFGDVRLLALLGAATGPLGVPAGPLSALVVAHLLAFGAVIGGRATIAFGPYLVVGCLTAGVLMA